MPGVCLAIGRETGGFAETLEQQLHFDRYRSETLRSNASLFLGYTTHPGYPVTVVEDEEYLCYMEGWFYGATDQETVLRSLAPLLFDAQSHRVEEFLLNTDGEFLVATIDKQTGTLALVNDLLGRLPVYQHRTDDGVVVAREPGFVLDSGAAAEFDRLGLGQTLLFGYTLGERTLWEGVRRLPPATQLLVDRDGEVTARSHHVFDFGEKRHRNKSPERNARTLVSLFRDACRRRTEVWDRTVLSLSGGLDSRAVLAGLRSDDVPFSAATFARADGSTDAELRIAEQIAETTGIDWEPYRLDSDRTSDMAKLLELKEGLNPVTMGFILEFFDRLREAYGHRMTYLTGDGGDKTLPDIAPAVDVRSEEELVSYILSADSVFSLSEVSDLTGLDPDAITDELVRVVSGYPESDWRDKYVHFQVAERGRNWLFEGEDRNRCVFWSTSPFYSVEFFRYAMNVPHEQKSRYRLYRQFFETIWPSGAAFDHADFGASLDSPLYAVMQYGLELLDGYPRIKTLVRDLHRSTGGAQSDETHRAVLERQLATCEPVRDLLSAEMLDRIATDRRSCSTKQLNNLLTLTAAIDRQRCNEPVLTADGTAVLERPNRP